jgi:D-threonate/D-erythronate kinase
MQIRPLRTETKEMTDNWLILADDLTGAADCAIPFAKNGIDSIVTWGERDDAEEEQPTVLSYNLDSRTVSASDAVARHRKVLDRCLRPGIKLYKKIDSTLRGHPGAEIAVTLQAMSSLAGTAFGILAPAFPATGRTTINGRVRVGDQPLEDTEVWQRDHSYPNSDLVDMLATAGVRAHKVPLDVIRSGVDTLKSTFDGVGAKGALVAVCDAMTQKDLDTIVSASLPASEGTFFIGSAGLAHSLASCMMGERLRPIDKVCSTRGALIVAGSLAAVSRTAARSLAAIPNVRDVRVAPEILCDSSAEEERAAITRAVIDALEAGEDVLIEMLVGREPSLSLGPRLAAHLSEMLEPAAMHMSGLVATGGETASALLSHFGVRGIRLVDEIDPGVCLGVTLGDMCVPVVTKSGAFGDPESLIRILEYLRRSRQLEDVVVREAR